MRTEIMPITQDDHGYDQHPAWILVGASRVSATPGAVLFDSDILHQHYVIVRIRRATRKRNLNHDWIHADGRHSIVEIAMSEAQWASFVSTMNVGDGVPATLKWDATRDDPRVPAPPYQPRLQVSMEEVHNAALEAQKDVLEAFAAYKEKKTVDNLRTLQARIDNLAPNIDFAAQSLAKHAENVVTRARADIEAFVVTKAQQLGLEPGDLGEMPQLTEGESEL